MSISMKHIPEQSPHYIGIYIVNSTPFLIKNSTFSAVFTKYIMFLTRQLIPGNRAARAVKVIINILLDIFLIMSSADIINLYSPSNSISITL